jgi:hypothetical protein
LVFRGKDRFLRIFIGFFAANQVSKGYGQVLLGSTGVSSRIGSRFQRIKRIGFIGSVLVFVRIFIGFFATNQVSKGYGSIQGSAFSV